MSWSLQPWTAWPSHGGAVGLLSAPRGCTSQTPLPLHHPCKTKPCPHPQGSCSTCPGSSPALGCRGMSGSVGDPSCQDGVCAGMSPAGDCKPAWIK